ncbi:MAG: GTPase [Bacillales bacterium]|jgi:ribosome biogenesis GTPase|nr:GTPase [Bacillales bacterium]
MPKGIIIKALSGFYYVKDDKRIVQCRGRGVFRNKNINPLVGDFVEYEADNDSEGTITVVGARKNELVRPPISNIDQAILVFSSKEPEFSTILLDRFLVLIESKNIKPIICISKVDLLNPIQTKKIEQFRDDYVKIGYEVLLLSSKTMEGVIQIIPYLQNKTSVFAGQSGVGKSSLLNALNKELNLKTDQISMSLGRGKHTTRHVELIEVCEGFVADTPGFSSLEFNEVEEGGLGACFPEISKNSENCKFRGCLHLKEPQCAVKNAVGSGEIMNFRYEHYEQFIEEIKDRKPRY